LDKLFDTNLPNVKYLFTDDKDNPYVEEWVWDVCADASKNKLPQLDDNPFVYDIMSEYDRDYTALYLVNDRPTYGYYFKKTPHIDKRLIRKLRAYNLDQKNFRLTNIKFWKEEANIFRNHLKPFFAKQGIDTIFFTRHVEANGVKENKWRSNRKTPKIGYTMYSVFDVEVKGFTQNVHYYSTDPSETIDDHSFASNFHKC
jgi:hypothetical protein|tara:strand:- start:436 stop:1035 length:600 start_codon:yes stop_codon:yes gene_type:complete